MTQQSSRAPKAVFDAPVPRVFSIPPSEPFVEVLATTLAEACGLDASADALAEAVVFLPNRRAARAFAEALHDAARRAGRPALIAPDIRVLGDLDEDDGRLTPSDLTLPPVLSPAKRRGALFRLIQRWRAAQRDPTLPPLPPGSALAAADELASLLDQSAMGEDADWARLKDVAMDADLAAHWHKSASFLDIVAAQWPKHLEEQGASDPLARRLAAAEAQAAVWAKEPPAHPVIVAGSTGATPASRTLMRAAMRLPKGAIVLPGLDPELSAAAWDEIGRASSHPQFTLGRALDRLGVSPDSVEPWPGADEAQTARARRLLINEALAPATRTKDWTRRLVQLAGEKGPTDLIQNGLDGLALIEAEDQGDEALLAALLLREALETPDRTAALVTPDPGLARRTSSLLTRWDVTLTPSGGTPLLQTSPGRYLGLLGQWARDPADPVLLLSVLKHELTRLGRSADVLASDVAELELAALRGPRRWRSLEQLRELFAEDAPQAAQLLIDLTKALSPWMERFGASHIDGAGASEAIARLAEHLAAAPDFKGAERVWRGAAGAASARYLEMLAELSQEIGPIDAELWSEFSEAAARDIKVPPPSDGHPRLAIWGPLEARLQTRDLIILGGLNEGSWPQSAAVDSFLPKRLRGEIGLPDPEERIGLSAHDFSQMACADEVVLLRAKRVDDKPAVASRWLWRLQTLAAAGLGKEALDAALAPDPNQDPRAWAAALNSVDQVEPMKPPEPRPPLDARPRKFSVSRVARLVRDPYAVYARDILKLEPLSPVGAQPGPAERGVAVHAAIERFENLDGASDLVALIGEELGAAGVPEEQVALETPLWRRASDKYFEWRADRTRMVVAAYPEVEGRIQIDLPAGKVELTGKADRIEELADGSLAIIDFKTGAPKTKKQVETGLEPQLPLEAAIASAGGFSEFDAASVSQLIYVAVSPGAHVGAAKNGAPLDLAPDEIAAATLNGVLKLVAAYDDIGQPYRSKPRVEFAWSVSDFDRLARRAEWMIDEGDE